MASTSNEAPAGNDIYIDYTVGEAAITTTLGDINSVHVTQGFHQPEWVIIDDIATQKADVKLSLYPTPAQNNIWVGYQAAKPGKVVITVIDMQGKTIATLANSAYDAGINVQSYDISAIPGGTYILNLQLGNNITSKSFTITK